MSVSARDYCGLPRSVACKMDSLNRRPPPLSATTLQMSIHPSIQQPSSSASDQVDISTSAAAAAINYNCARTNLLWSDPTVLIMTWMVVITLNSSVLSAIVKVIVVPIELRMVQFHFHVKFNLPYNKNHQVMVLRIVRWIGIYIFSLLCPNCFTIIIIFIITFGGTRR